MVVNLGGSSKTALGIKKVFEEKRYASSNTLQVDGNHHDLTIITNVLL